MIENKPKVAIYVRTNTKGSEMALQEQEEKLKTFSLIKGYDVYEIYSDLGFSSLSEERTSYNKLLKDLQLNKFNKILVYRLDKLSRSIFDIEKIFEVAKQCDCEIESLTENIDTSNASSKLLFRMVSIFNQFQTELEEDRKF